MIKTEKELLRLIWKEVGLGGHNADLKKRKIIAKEVHKAVEFGLKDCPPEEHEEVLDSIAGLFLSRIGDMKDEAFTQAFYTNLLSKHNANKENLIRDLVRCKTKKPQFAKFRPSSLTTLLVIKTPNKAINSPKFNC